MIQKPKRRRGVQREIVAQIDAVIGVVVPALDRFFVEVLVMDENTELKNNRIALLQSIQRVLSRTAELTLIVVDKTEYRDE